MLPYVEIFGRQVPMYGLLMLAGGTLAILLACIRGGKRGLDRLDILLAAVFAFLGGLLGAKLLFIITDIPNMIEHFRHAEFSFSWLMNRLASAGIVFYGGLIGGFVGGWIYTRLFYVNFWQYADAMIPFLPLAHAFGRLGCFCAGCCYGRQMDPPWGVHFTSGIGGSNPELTYFPSQLLEAGFNLLILLPILLVFSRKQRKPGQIVGLYFVCYGVFRFVNEYFRGDEIRGIFGGVSTSQWISLALIPIGILLLSGAISDKLRVFDAVLPRGGEEIVEFIEDDDADEASDLVNAEDAGEYDAESGSQEAEEMPAETEQN